MYDPIDVTSPPWMQTTRILVGISVILMMALLVVETQALIAPLILVVVVIFSVRPLAVRLHGYLNVPWGLSLALVYLAVLIITGLAASELGVALANQAVDLAQSAQDFAADPPDIVSQLPFANLLPANLNIQTLLDQFASLVQPLFGSMGSLLGNVFGTAATAVGWLFFILGVSFFILLDLSPENDWSVVRFVPAPYKNDIKQIGRRLSHIWQSFLYGQGLLFVLTVIVVAIVLMLLGVQNALALGLLSGFARFVPYVGPAIVWSLVFVVTFTQDSTLFGMSSLLYAFLVIAIQIVIDSVFDNVVSPRVFKQVLGLHPAAILVMAFAAVTTIGPVGLLVAAPLLATLIQLGGYVTRKLFDVGATDLSSTKIMQQEYPPVKKDDGDAAPPMKAAESGTQ